MASLDERAFAHAVGKVRSDFVGAVANGSGGYLERARHISAILDLSMSLVQVIVQNQIPFPRRQTTKTVTKTNGFLAWLDPGLNRNLDVLSRDLSASSSFTNDIPRNAMKVVRGLIDVTHPDLSQSSHHAIDRLVSKILSVVEALQYKRLNQARTNPLITLPGQLTVSV